MLPESAGPCLQLETSHVPEQRTLGRQILLPVTVEAVGLVVGVLLYDQVPPASPGHHLSTRLQSLGLGKE